MRSWCWSLDALANRALIAELIGGARIPALYPFSEFVDAGGLMAYSFDLTELIKRVANDIDAILRGANPGDIPYYQVSKFELSINLKTAQGARARRVGDAAGQRRQGD
jgi:putative ABC transport system substrate-binding protein